VQSAQLIPTVAAFDVELTLSGGEYHDSGDSMEFLTKFIHWVLSPWKKNVTILSIWNRSGNRHEIKMPGVQEANITVKLNPELPARMAYSNNYFDVSLLFPRYILLNIGSEFKVWLYNVGSMSHEVHRPVGHISIPACKKEEKYTVVTSLPGTILFTNHKTCDSTVDFTIEDGRRVAMDIINPDNFGIDQNACQYSISQGADLGKLGVFWSLNNPPLKFEIDAAVARMEKHYTSLLKIYWANQSNGPETRAALEYFHKQDSGDSVK
jgi:hypothetical protein